MARVLAVDNDPSICGLIADTLRPRGHDVRTATRVEDALKQIEQPWNLDLAILDIMMPLLTGDELAEVIRRHHPDAKVLFITGYPDRLFSTHPALGKNEALLEKPFSANGLVEAVTSLLLGSTKNDSGSRFTAGA